jgi:hypothetical protein
VSLSSLAHYRRALADFVRALPSWLARSGEDAEAGQGLRSIDGGLA